jgi:hypothetical protein
MLHLLLTSLLFSLGTMATAWKQEDGWIPTCTAAGCPGMRSLCLTYVAGGKRYYCYRNHEN